MFFIGLSLVSPVGYYLFQIFDNYSLNFGLLTVGFFQAITVSWVYGNDKYDFVFKLKKFFFSEA